LQPYIDDEYTCLQKLQRECDKLARNPRARTDFTFTSKLTSPESTAPDPGAGVSQ
jgi:hypothetical protein